jgi:hypothetical protein
MERPREILKVKVEVEGDPTVVTNTVRGRLGGFPIEKAIAHPECIMAVEDFFAGDTIRWAFHHAEFQYILKGKAELVYTLPPWHDEQKTLKVQTGDAYLIPNGADITFKIDKGAPFRKMCVVMPAEMGYFEVPPKDVKQLKK